MSSEAKAYGFTLVVWTTGALLVSLRGTPRPVEALAFVVGALAAMAVTIAAAFGEPATTWRERHRRRLAWGAIHLASVSLAVLAAWGVAAMLSGVAAFVAAPFAAVLLFQSLLALEVMLSVADE